MGRQGDLHSLAFGLDLLSEFLDPVRSLPDAPKHRDPVDLDSFPVFIGLNAHDAVIDRASGPEDGPVEQQLLRGCVRSGGRQPRQGSPIVAAEREDSGEGGNVFLVHCSGPRRHDVLLVHLEGRKQRLGFVYDNDTNRHSVKPQPRF